MSCFSLSLKKALACRVVVDSARWCKNRLRAAADQFVSDRRSPTQQHVSKVEQSKEEAEEQSVHKRCVDT